MRHSMITLALLVMLASSRVHGQTKPAMVPPKSWTSRDDVLRLSVEKWPAHKKGSKPTATYTVDVSHLVNPTREDQTWFLGFAPSSRAPASLPASCIAWIVKDKGWIAGLSLRGAEQEREVVPMNAASVLLRPVEGFPVELLHPSLPAQKITTDRGTLQVLREEDGDGVILVAIINMRGQDQVQITQFWKKDECWWREYTRAVNGRKDLHAKFAAVVPLQQALREECLRENHNAFTMWDDRLAVKVKLVKEDPTLAEIMAVVEKASGVRLSVDDSLRGYRPDFGSCQLNCAAWVIVNFMASHGFHNAKWVERKGGLRLEPARPMTDAGLKDLADEEDLASLNLFGTQVTDAGLKELARMPSLKVLDLGHTRITDAGLKELAALRNLTELDLDDTQVTDAGLKEVAGLKKLVSLKLPRTRVTDAGVAELRQAIPACVVER